MNATETTGSAGNATRPSTRNDVHRRQHNAGQYRKVFDSRKRRIRGLWQRNETYYAQIAIPGATGAVVRRVRLEDGDGRPVATVAAAVAAMARLKVKREDSKLKIDPKRTPPLAEYAHTYLDRMDALGSKRPATRRRERGSLRLIVRRLGHLRLRQVTPAGIADYMAGRIKEGVSHRGVNIEVVVLRNLLKSAIADGYISTLPPVKRLREEKPTRRLLTLGEIERVAQAAVSVSPSTGPMVRDFVLLMAFSGGRWGETLRLTWGDVDFTRGQLRFGGDGLSKNGEVRTVDFNDRLKDLLEAMAKRRVPDSQFLFPGRWRTENRDMPTISFNKTLRAARTAAGVADFRCHDCRHFFASFSLMSRVDLQTVAAWLGHRDHGVLLSRVYSHLLNEHKASQAKLVSFGPTLLESKNAVNL